MVDHHQHLLSPAMAAAWSEKPLPAVELPADLARLLVEIEKGWNDKAALARLYTEDSLVVRSDRSWVRGREAVSAHLAETFTQPYRITPVSYSLEGSTAHVAGYLTTGEGETARHFGHVLVSLRKGTDAAWRVATETLTFPGLTRYKPVTADDLVALMDAAGIQRALVLSVAYWYGSPRRQIENEYEKVRADNDWTAGQAARFPDRLRAFCGFSPLKDYALEELERCAKHPHIKGLKFHFGNSRVDLRDAKHVEQVRRVFRAANERRLPIVIHLRSSAVPYGRQYAEIFLSQILPAAPDIPIQIAHLAGSGPGYEDPPSDEALTAFAEAISAGNPHTKNLYFDITTLVNLDISVEKSKLLAGRIRQLGVKRVLYGSDLAVGGNLAPRQAWALIRGLLPLSEQEFTIIANNVAPYMR